jgi:hypothetical protein
MVLSFAIITLISFVVVVWRRYMRLTRDLERASARCAEASANRRAVMLAIWKAAHG